MFVGARNASQIHLHFQFKQVLSDYSAPFASNKDQPNYYYESDIIDREEGRRQQ
jgi:hypothetical protein